MKVPVPADQCMRLVVTRPVMIITTLHENGVLNAGVYGAYTNVSPTDAAIAIWTGSHTYQNILRSRQFAINVPPASLAPKFATLAQNVPPSRSELEVAGLTPFPCARIEPDGIAECVAVIECEFAAEFEVGAHGLILGRALGGHVEEEVWSDEGRLDVVKAGICHCVAYPEPHYAAFDRVFRAE